MRHSRIFILVLAPLAPMLATCGDDEPSGPSTSFSATLSGSEEVPPVPTSATGTATFNVSSNLITYTVSVTNIQNAVVSHIHVGRVGEIGPVRLNLCGTGSPLPDCTSGTGVLVTGSNGTTVGITFDSLVSAMRTGGAYVNVHTDDGQGQSNTGPGDMASGEIRGQIVAE